MIKKISLAIALIFTIFGIYIVGSSYHCTGWLCDIGAYVVALPWSKLWDFSGPLSSENETVRVILNGVGVIINSLIIFYVIRFIGLGINKLRK